MTTTQITIIQHFARTMPSYWQYTKRRLSGAELLDMGYTHWEGEAVDAERHYTVEVRVHTNQVRRLTKLYRTKGAEVLSAELGSIAAQLIAQATPSNTNTATAQ